MLPDRSGRLYCKKENVALHVHNSRWPSPTPGPIPHPVNSGLTEIIVVRPVESEWNARRRIQGQVDVELKEVGKKQASLVANRLAKDFKIAAVYSSDLKRALVTAETIASRCGGLEIILFYFHSNAIDQSLCNKALEAFIPIPRHLGDLQGLRLHDASKVSPKAYQAIISNRIDQDIPGGGESINQVFDRCTSSLERIAKKHRGEQVVVVTHAGVITQLFWRACPHKMPKGRVLNTSVNIFCISDGDKWTLKISFDISHLKQIGLQSGTGGGATSA